MQREARRGPVGVVQHERTLGHHRLHARAGGHGALALGEERLDVRDDGWVFVQRASEQSGDAVARDVVGGRPQPAGGDDEVRAAQRLAHGLLNVVRRVRDRDLPRDDVAEVCELAAEPLLMSV